MRRQRFKMETLKSILLALRKDNFLANLGLEEAYLHVPVLPAHHKFLWFCYQGSHFLSRTSVLPVISTQDLHKSPHHHTPSHPEHCAFSLFGRHPPEVRVTGGGPLPPRPNHQVPERTWLPSQSAKESSDPDLVNRAPGSSHRFTPSQSISLLEDFPPGKRCQKISHKASKVLQSHRADILCLAKLLRMLTSCQDIIPWSRANA